MYSLSVAPSSLDGRWWSNCLSAATTWCCCTAQAARPSAIACRPSAAIATTSWPCRSRCPASGLTSCMTTCTTGSAAPPPIRCSPRRVPPHQGSHATCSRQAWRCIQRAECTRKIRRWFPKITPTYTARKRPTRSVRCSRCAKAKACRSVRCARRSSTDRTTRSIARRSSSIAFVTDVPLSFPTTGRRRCSGCRRTTWRVRPSVLRRTTWPSGRRTIWATFRLLRSSISCICWHGQRAATRRWHTCHAPVFYNSAAA